MDIFYIGKLSLVHGRTFLVKLTSGMSVTCHSFKKECICAHLPEYNSLDLFSPLSWTAERLCSWGHLRGSNTPLPFFTDVFLITVTVQYIP